MSYRLSAEELAATQAKVAKLNERAARKGLAGHVDLVATRKTEVVTNESGITVEVVYYDTEITGAAPQYNGWEFIAVLSWDSNAGLITRTVPGYEGQIDRSRLVEGKCDHCKVDRYRKETYLLRNASGQTVQVGSTCLRDFLGADVTPAFIFGRDVTADLGEPWGYDIYGEPDVSTESALAIAWAAVETFGFHRSDSDSPTKLVVHTVLHPSSHPARRDDDLALARKLRPVADRATAQARLIRDFILSDDFKGDSEYVINLKSILAADKVSSKNYGLLASAPQAWARAVERDLRRKAEQAGRVNEYIGQPGDKIEITANIKSIRAIEGTYGTSALYTLVTTDGHLVKWFSSNWGLGEDVDNTTWTLRATVKKHEDYQGSKSTVITRAKVMSTAA